MNDATEKLPPVQEHVSGAAVALEAPVSPGSDGAGPVAEAGGGAVPAESGATAELNPAAAAATADDSMASSAGQVSPEAITDMPAAGGSNAAPQAGRGESRPEGPVMQKFRIGSQREPGGLPLPGAISRGIPTRLPDVPPLSGVSLLGPSAPAAGAVANAAPAAPAAPKPALEGAPRGKKGGGGAAPVIETVPHTVDIPNLRASEADDVEAMVAAEMGESSIDHLVSHAGVPVELTPDTRLRAKVVSIYQDTVFFELPGGQQGAVPQQKFKSLPALGSEHEVVVKGASSEDGVLELGLPGAVQDVSAWDDLQEGALVEAKITGANIGGLECNVSGIRGFIPASQVSIYRVENLSEFIGQKLECVVVEAKRSKRNLVLSRRGVLEREQEAARKKLLETLTEGEVREGIVRSMRDFGAFVDLGGIDGLVHIRQLSWERIKHPSEVLEVGQKIKVKVERINPQTGKITLMFRDLSENPWLRATERYAVGSKVKGTVSKLAEFGAFVKLEPGIEGLIHISELAYGRIWRAADVVKEGQEVETKVMAVDPDAQRISLSLKALTPPPASAKRIEEPEPEPEPLTSKSNPKKFKALKGGISRPSGGEQFGLKW